MTSLKRSLGMAAFLLASVSHAHAQERAPEPAPSPTLSRPQFTLSYSTSDPFTLPNHVGLPILDQTGMKNTFGISGDFGFCEPGRDSGTCTSASVSHFDARDGDGDAASLTLAKPCAFFGVEGFSCNASVEWDKSDDATSTIAELRAGYGFHARPLFGRATLAPSLALALDAIDGDGAATILSPQFGLKLGFGPDTPFSLRGVVTDRLDLDTGDRKLGWGVDAIYARAGCPWSVAAGYRDNVTFADGELGTIHRTASLRVSYRFPT